MNNENTQANETGTPHALMTTSSTQLNNDSTTVPLASSYQLSEVSSAVNPANACEQMPAEQTHKMEPTNAVHIQRIYDSSDLPATSEHSASVDQSLATAVIANIETQPVLEAADSVATPSTTKQALRYQLASKFTSARCEIESQVSAVVNAKCGQRYKGTFDVRFDSPNEVTQKTLSAFCGAGTVFFTPDDLDQHPTLKKVRKAEDGINLSALMTRAKRPANIDDKSWQELEAMWNEVSKTLYSQGLAPMHILIAGVLAANGLGGPKINKKLGGSTNVSIDNKIEVMCKVLDELNELLTVR